jgi:hypothetical protein
MKLLTTLLFSLMLAMGQAATRPATLSWTASTSVGVIGYYVNRAATSTGPWTLLTPTPIVATTFTDNPTVGLTYTYQIVAVAAPCTPTTPITQVCGSSIPAVVTTTVPPVPNVTVTVTVVVP